jgi:hypothetical protein
MSTGCGYWEYNQGVAETATVTLPRESIQIDRDKLRAVVRKLVNALKCRAAPVARLDFGHFAFWS